MTRWAWLVSLVLGLVAQVRVLIRLDVDEMTHGDLKIAGEVVGIPEGW